MAQRRTDQFRQSPWPVRGHSHRPVHSAARRPSLELLHDARERQCGTRFIDLSAGRGASTFQTRTRRWWPNGREPSPRDLYLGTAPALNVDFVGGFSDGRETFGCITTGNVRNGSKADRSANVRNGWKAATPK